MFKRVCRIRANDGELLPEWARFARGVVDCPDLQATAARDNVLRDKTYDALREALGETLVSALLDLAARDRPRFLQLCDWQHDAIKGMAATPFAVRRGGAGHCPSKRIRGQLTLPDYLNRQPPSDGKRPLYFFTDAADANQFYALCQARGLLAINAGRSFDRNVAAPLRRSTRRNRDAQGAGSFGRSIVLSTPERRGTNP
ncbi:MAG: hypothetical protein IPI57_13555 [Candidatus Competibacteraceae bacterium]|nr:hypothetical protein [Candidatus Competibacteraceae bacterium]